jgi:imidazolonepropionase-like amidohydrolase
VGRTVVLSGGSILDTEAGELSGPRDVVIEDELIQAVGECGSSPEGAERYDITGKVVMPGLIDAHVHVTSCTTDLRKLVDTPRSLGVAYAGQVLKAMLMRGFTTVRDAGGADAGIAEAIRCGYFVGPRLFPSGFALAQTGGQGDFRPVSAGEPRWSGAEFMGSSMSRVVDGTDQARLAAREELSRGATQLKVMAGGGIAGGIPVERAHFSSDELRAVVGEAEDAATYVMAHAYSPEAIRRSVDAGVRSVEHGNLIDAETAAFMEGQAYLVPTLAVYKALAEPENGSKTASAKHQRAEWLLEEGLKSIEIAREAGVKVGFGTDLEGPLEQKQLSEFTIRTAVQSNAEILASVTAVNAEIMNLRHQVGVLRAGAYADLLVLDGDPLADIGILSGERGGDQIQAVIKAGVIVKGDLRPIQTNEVAQQQP